MPHLFFFLSITLEKLWQRSKDASQWSFNEISMSETGVHFLIPGGIMLYHLIFWNCSNKLVICLCNLYLGVWKSHRPYFLVNKCWVNKVINLFQNILLMCQTTKMMTVFWKETPTKAQIHLYYFSENVFSLANTVKSPGQLSFITMWGVYQSSPLLKITIRLST